MFCQWNENQVTLSHADKSLSHCLLVHDANSHLMPNGTVSIPRGWEGGVREGGDIYKPRSHYAQGF